MRDLPPLHTLLAFEAAARLGSFQAAAQALCLTASAISHRIRLLESHLGQPLFERRHRAVVLTASGRRYLAVVRDALLRLDEASAVLRSPQSAVRTLAYFSRSSVGQQMAGGARCRVSGNSSGD